MEIKGTKREQKRVRKALRYLPGSLQDLLIHEGIRFRVETRRFGGYRFGKFEYVEKIATIYRQPWFHLGLSMTSTTIHEAGHALDQATGTTSESIDFAVAMKHDRDDLRAYEKRSGPAEAFADTVVAIWGPWWARLFLRGRPMLKHAVKAALGQ